MPFIKYEVEAKQPIDIKLNPNGISIGVSALEAHGLAEAEYVNLYWDSDFHLIGIAASDKSDKSAFRIAQRGRGTTSKFIAATKFFDKFGIPVEDATVASGLKTSNGIAAFELDLPVASASRRYISRR